MTDVPFLIVHVSRRCAVHGFRLLASFKVVPSKVVECTSTTPSASRMRRAAIRTREGCRSETGKPMMQCCVTITQESG